MMQARASRTAGRVTPLALVLLLATSTRAQCDNSGGARRGPPGVDYGGGVPGLSDRRVGPRTGLGNPRPETTGTQWERWWEYNKAPWLRLKESIYTGAPVTGLPVDREHDLPIRLFAPNGMDRGKAALALRALTEGRHTNRDVRVTSLLALARSRADMDVVNLLRSFLSSKDPKQAEYAALGLGLTGLREALPDLLALATCSKRGHTLADREHVPYRLRAWACYAVALLAHGAQQPDLTREVYGSLREVVANPNRHDVKVGALHALRLLNPDLTTYRGQKLHHEILAFLVGFLDKRKTEAPQVRAHALAALGRLGGRDASRPYIARVLHRLQDRRESHWVHQAAVIALGQLAEPSDEQTCGFLRQYEASGMDRQARFLATIGLGRIGGSRNRTHLLRRLRKKKTPSIQKPWLALGLAILDRRRREADSKLPPDLTVCDAIHLEFRRTRNPSTAAGLATALGILRYRDAGRDVLERLDRYRNRDDAAGHLAVALSLMGFTEATERLERIVAESFNHPRLLANAAIALALLGNKDVSRTLVSHLVKRRSSGVHAALVQALGYIGDRRSVGPLIDMLNDEKLGSIARAFTASALGNVADVALLPWDTALAVDVPYETPIETLTSAVGSGILDTY